MNICAVCNTCASCGRVLNITPHIAVCACHEDAEHYVCAPCERWLDWVAEHPDELDATLTA